MRSQARRAPWAEYARVRAALVYFIIHDAPFAKTTMVPQVHSGLDCIEGSTPAAR